MSFISIGDEVGTGGNDRLKGVKDGEDVIGFVFEEVSKAFQAINYHFIDKKGSIRCTSTKDKKDICCTAEYKSNARKIKLGAPVIQYLFHDEACTKLKSFKVLPFLFSEQVYNSLVKVHKRHDLAKVDIDLACTDPKYQSFNVSPRAGSIWRDALSEEQRTSILAKAKKISDNIPNMIARKYTESEIKEKLGIEQELGDTGSLEINLDEL